MIKLVLTFEMDREAVKELFEANEIKFSVKKLKDLQEDLDYVSDDIQVQLEEQFEEIVNEKIQELFE